MAGLSAGRLESTMDDNNSYNHSGVNAYDRNCEANVGQMDQKESTSLYTIQGVLHFLQTEWTRLEMQRSQWEVERAELQARIAFLQGERRGQENLKQDLVRRIKMLEYGLKQERVKFHQYKASVLAGNSPQALPKSQSQDLVNVHSNLKDDIDSTKRTLEPGEKLAQCAEQAFESNVKWRESRLRLKQLLQEVGFTDEVLNVREARVRHLLRAAAGWSGEPDSPNSSADSKQTKGRGGQEFPWMGEKLGSQTGDKANIQDDQTRVALAEIEEAVRSAEDSLEPSSSSAVLSNELGDQSAEPDTTGNSFGGADNLESADTAWVNRFRRTGGPSTIDSAKHKPQTNFLLNDELNSKGISSSTTAISSFLNNFAEFRIPNQMKRIGRKYADANILDLINTLSEKVDDENGGFVINPVSEINSVSSASVYSDNVTTSSTTILPNSQKLPSALAVAPGSAPWCTEFADTTMDLSGQICPKDRSPETGKESNPNEMLVLGDLASLTVANEAETALNYWVWMLDHPDLCTPRTIRYVLQHSYPNFSNLNKISTAVVTRISSTNYAIERTPDCSRLVNTIRTKAKKMKITNLNGEMCDSNLPQRTSYDPTVLSASDLGTNTCTSFSSGLMSSRHPWAPKYTLRGHFDGIRNVIFHPTERAVYTAGEDGCIILWNLSKTGASNTVSSQAKSVSGVVDELSPTHVYCGHNGPVLCLATPNPSVAPTTTTALYSGGLDGTVRSWRLPSASGSFGTIDLYAPHEMENTVGPTFQNSESSIWALALHPSSPVLLSAHSNGSLNFWSTVDLPDSAATSNTPALSIHLDRLVQIPDDQPSLGRPTCLHFLINRPDSLTASQCVVGTSTGWLVLLDVQTGQLINQVAPAPAVLLSGDDQAVNIAKLPDSEDRNLPSGWTQRCLNALGSHQTLSLVIGAHEDRCVRFYDIGRMSNRSAVTNSACVGAMVTHLDAVTSLAVDPHGLYLLTGSHDASIRVWDMESRACIQEMTNHGFKYNESIHSVALHPQLPLAASAGADAVCKVYTTAA